MIHLKKPKTKAEHNQRLLDLMEVYINASSLNTSLLKLNFESMFTKKRHQRTYENFRLMILPFVKEYENTDEKMHEMASNGEIDIKEDPIEMLQGGKDKMVSKVAEIQSYQTEEICTILDAYKKDPKSILGIAKKVLR